MPKIKDDKSHNEDQEEKKINNIRKLRNKKVRKKENPKNGTSNNYKN